MRFSWRTKNIVYVFVTGILLLSSVVYLLHGHVVTTNQDFEYLPADKPPPYKYSSLQDWDIAEHIRGVGTETAMETEAANSYTLSQEQVRYVAAETDGHFVNDQLSTFTEGSLKDEVGIYSEGSLDEQISAFTEGSLNVFVVEEHHEVIPYWFEAANRGTIPKEGNLLVHIDGHIDTAPLLYVHGFPFFKWPITDELRYLMQRNDGFIQGAAMAGLVDRMVWVWPMWDENNTRNTHDSSYVTYDVQLGWFDVTNETRAASDVAFCMCVNDSEATKCWTLTETESDLEQGLFYNVNSDRCQILKTITIEEMSEQFSISYFENFDRKSKTRRASIILDIDEDFYGCSYAVNPIIEAKVDLEKILKINEVIQFLFCPETSEQDAETNRFLVHFFSEIAKGDTCKYDVLKRSVKCLEYIEKQINIFTKKMIILQIQNIIQLCQPYSIYNLDEVKQFLLIKITDLTNKQILSLVEVGFCANTSPKTHDIFGSRKFGICMGANSPNNSAVLEHIPTETEVDSRTLSVRRILQKIGRPVNVVTIARSIRDGYTPRKHFEQIERDVIENLRETLDKNLHVHYDKDLLGGKKGWGTSSAE